jgi:hypothetical protein
MRIMLNRLKEELKDAEIKRDLLNDKIKRIKLIIKQNHNGSI